MSAHTKNHFWTDVAVYEDLNDGKNLETFLRGRGFEARTFDDKVYRMFLFLRPPQVTYRVQVRHSDLKSADYLVENSVPELLQKAIQCPECNSRRIAYPQMTRRFVLPTVLLHLGIIFRVIEHECYCEHCHYTWNLPSEHARLHPKPAPQALPGR